MPKLMGVMKRNPRMTAIVAVIIVATVLSSQFIGRGVMRLYALHKFLKLPAVAERIAVMPTRQTLKAPVPVHPINLGYASFDTGRTNAITIESRAEGTTLVLSNRDVSLVIFPPSAPPKISSKTNVVARLTEAEIREHPRTVAYLQLNETNHLVGQMNSEQRLPQSGFRIFLMSDDDFLLYSIQIGLKGALKSGANEVRFFETPTTWGIIRIGNSATDRHFANAFLTSLDGTEEVGFNVTLADGSSTKIEDVLDPMVGSFRFTTTRVDDPEQIKKLIRETGIQAR